VPETPDQLMELVEEFTNISMRQPRRKLLVRMDLAEKRTATEKRLIEGAEASFADLVEGKETKTTTKEYGQFWLSLYDAYQSINDALWVPDEDQLRIDAAKLIFSAEEYEEPEPEPMTPLQAAFHENGVDYQWM
jgi:hypothetical protein